MKASVKDQSFHAITGKLPGKPSIKNFKHSDLAVSFFSLGILISEATESAKFNFKHFDAPNAKITSFSKNNKMVKKITSYLAGRRCSTVCESKNSNHI